MTDYKEYADKIIKDIFALTIAPFEVEQRDLEDAILMKNIIKVAILSQQRVVDAYHSSANEIINSREDRQSVILLRTDAQNLLKELQSRL